MSASMDSDEETFVTLGSPLEVFEDDEPIKKPVSIYDLQAKDVKGRPRFHGAFTGGFSAGFFNTVGSKEGFTPSTFVSSRNSKASSSAQNVEDFMDEEDLGEHGIAPKKYTTSSDYTSEEQNRKRKAMATSLSSSSIIPGEPALVDLIIPEKLSVGVRLLRKMGWKEGQGIGPRRRKKKKKKNSSARVIGCALPPSESEEEEFDDSNLPDITFAPKDTNPISFEAKDNVHGLGYRGLDPRAALPSSHINLFEPPPVRSRGHKGIRGQAFGVGALEEEDADIYCTDHLSNYDMTMDIGEKDSNFGWTAPGKHKPTSQTSLPVGYIGKLLDGFTLSSKPLTQKKVFKPPTLPRHFRPFHHFKKKQSEPATQPGVDLSELMTQPRRKEPLNAVDRGLILGETPIFTSVFDLVSRDDKKKMEEAKLSTGVVRPDDCDKSDRNRDQSPPDELATLTEVSENRVDPSKTEPSQTAPLSKGNLSFKPFSQDNEKQARYEVYLSQVKQGHKDPYAAVESKRMTEWERDKEREEFTKAAKLYKPLIGLMAHRFTTAKYLDEVDKADIPDETKEKSEQAKAAEMKLFGRLTRDECDWVPDKLLCRRFNVPHPYPGSTVVGVPTVRKEKFSVFNFLTFSDHMTTSQAPATQDPLAIEFDDTSQQKQQTEASSDKRAGLSMKVKPRSLGKPASIFSVLDENYSKRKPLGADHESPPGEALPQTQENMETNDDRPSVDLFKAIFKNSDSESSSSSESEDAADVHITDVVVIDTERKQTNDAVINMKTGHSEPNGSSETQEGATLQDVSSVNKLQLFPLAGDNAEDRLSPPVLSDSISDGISVYGPALPPPDTPAESGDPSTRVADGVSARPLAMSDELHRKQKHRHRHKHKTEHKHKHKKEKKVKHKKTKHKKKEKKHRKKKRSSDNGYESSSESEGDTTSSDSERMDRLKSISRKRFTTDLV